MQTIKKFEGFTEDTYQFFWEIAFQGEKSFFEANRARYRANVYEPLLALSAALGPTVTDIDERLNTKPSATVSRIRRDTRYSRDKAPYRDHAWLGFRMPGTFISEGFTLYADINRDSYGYGMGMYAPNSEMMKGLRDRMLAQPKKFLAMVSAPAFAEKFDSRASRINAIVFRTCPRR